MQCALESFYRGPWAGHAEGRVAACLYPAARVEHVLAQLDILARNVWLVRAAAVVATDDAAVGGRALRPVDPVILERELLRRMVARGQTRDEWRNRPGHWIHGHDTRAVVLSRRVGRLVRVAREQAAALESALEGDVDSRARRLEADPRSCWLAKLAFQVPILIEYEDVGGKGIVRGEGSPRHHVLFVACAR